MLLSSAWSRCAVCALMAVAAIRQRRCARQASKNGLCQRTAITELRQLVPPPRFSRPFGGEHLDSDTYQRFLQVVHWDVERAAKLLKADLEWRAKTRPWALRPSHMPSACRQQAWQVLMGPTRSRALLKWKQHPRHASGQHTLQPEAVNSSRPTTWLRRKMSLATRLKRRELHPPYHCPPLMQWRYTRHGLPITVLEVRHWYPERYKGGKREEALHVAYHMEHYIRRMPFRRGRRVERCCIIISLKGFRASTVPHVVHCVNILRKHYPGRLGIACLIDVPNYFYPFWRVISPYLDEEIMSKVHFLPSSVKGTEAAIEWCNKQKLPPFRDASLLV